MSTTDSSRRVELISNRMGIKPRQVFNVIHLLEEGATIPFISRYRKEATGNLDEVQIAEINSLSAKLLDLDRRKETILTTIEEQGKLTDSLRERIAGCYELSELEDIYLPYKPKRRTRATIAREKGLEPLALLVFNQVEKDILTKAQTFISDKVANVEEALQGARDIAAEMLSEDERVRNTVRRNFKQKAIIRSRVDKGKEAEGIKYS
ncbi:MAG TPA: Tex-like N-terminal domain-containing protein, partial [Tenuifilaceae bacterium]|nr:Tex-like N-terminal domain-containing protein [Tenuifilaceae bacterium]